MTEKEALNYAMKLCSKKEYSSGEILKKFKDFEVSDESAHNVLIQLKEDKFLDDHRFARAYVNDKLKFGKWGKIKITFMLRQKEVPESIINEAISEIDSKFYEEILLTELTKKIKGIKAVNPYELKGKLIQFASGRGFEFDIASRVADKLISKSGKGNNIP